LKAKKFTYRLADPYLPVEKEQDRHFPAIDKLNYDNYLISINQIHSTEQYQFTLLDGANCGSKGSGKNWISHQIS
jgi:hypothetical protein